MKYIAILALAVGALARPQDASSITSAPPTAASAALTPQVSCALACNPGDVTCQAACLGIARPNSSQVVETNECAAKCDQGDGSPAATEKFSQCVQACISSHFPSSQTAFGGPGNAAPSGAASSAGATGAVQSAASSAAASGASKAASATGSQATGSATSSTTASTSSPGAGNSVQVQAAGVGLAGLVFALFAL